MDRIGIIGAMPSELFGIRETLGEAQVRNISGFDYYINEYCGKELINVCSGIAKVNSALATQVLIDNFDPDAIINTGVAGGMGESVSVCDIVISEDVMSHDLDMGFLESYTPYCSVFRADETLVAAAQDVCIGNGIRCHTGRIVSGEAFISSDEVKADIMRRLSPCAVDMESAAVGHCCYMNKIPFVSVRCISDNADDNGIFSYKEFEKIAAGRVAEIVLSMSKIL